jgi:hypothetical protein
MNCHTDKVSAGLCEVIVELGQRFGLKTVAEGIEMTHECHKLQARLREGPSEGLMARRIAGGAHAAEIKALFPVSGDTSGPCLGDTSTDGRPGPNVSDFSGRGGETGPPW